MTTSNKGIELIMRHEGLRLGAYLCPAGIWTIGYGHTADVHSGMTITPAEAAYLLRDDVGLVDCQLKMLCDVTGVKLRQCQWDALASFVFNLGLKSLKSSTLWKLIQADPDDARIADEFARWVYAKGRRLPGLIARRADETRLYFSFRTDKRHE